MEMKWVLTGHKSYTIVRVHTDDEVYFDAMEVNTPLNPYRDIEFADGSSIPPDAYEIILEGLTTEQADLFLALSLDEQERIAKELGR